MLFLTPASVSLLGVELDAVELVAIDRKPDRLITEWSDAGPHPVFADVAQQRTTLRIRRRLSDPSQARFAGVIVPGAQGAFAMRASHTAAELVAVAIDATVVVASVEHDLSQRAGATQTITCVALSSDGASDPFTVQEVSP